MMNASKAACIAGLLILAHLHTASAATWHLEADGSGDAPTIQDAVNMAAAGDTLLLAPGTYSGTGNRSVGLTKAIVVTSSHGPEVTIIDCRGNGRGFRINNLYPARATVQGLTITNGVAPQGGAIYIYNSVATVHGNIITNSTATDGGGIYNFSFVGDTEITSNVVSGNVATGNGGGVWISNSYGPFEGNTISGNSASGMGGGIYAEPGGGGINNIITGNSAEMGGGIYKFGSGFLSYRITGNTAVYGGGVYSPSVYFSSSLVAGNTATFGAGVYTEFNSNILNSTVIDNSGIDLYFAGPLATIERSIIGRISCVSGSRNITFTCSNFYPVDPFSEACFVDGGNNINVDPQFCGMPPDSAYYLGAGSPCAPAQSPCGQQIGAFGVACSSPPPPVLAICPNDTVVEPVSFTFVPLRGFTIVNNKETDVICSYSLSVAGPAVLSDNGNFGSLSGVTPLLAPGESFAPPEASAILLEVTASDVVTVTYDVEVMGSNPLETGFCETTIVLDVVVPLLVQRFDARATGKRVELSWSVVTDEEAVVGYRLYRRDGEGATPRVLDPTGLVPATVRTLFDDDVDWGNTYSYSLAVLTENGQFRSEWATVTVQPRAFELRQNYPNPFNPETTIRFELAHPGQVQVDVYTSGGRRIRSLVNARYGAGAHDVTWDGRDDDGNRVASGVYYCRMQSGTATRTRKMLLLK